MRPGERFDDVMPCTGLKDFILNPDHRRPTGDQWRWCQINSITYKSLSVSHKQRWHTISLSASLSSQTWQSGEGSTFRFGASYADSRALLRIRLSTSHQKLCRVCMSVSPITSIIFNYIYLALNSTFLRFMGKIHKVHATYQTFDLLIYFS